MMPEASKGSMKMENNILKQLSLGLIDVLTHYVIFVPVFSFIFNTQTDFYICYELYIYIYIYNTPEQNSNGIDNVNEGNNHQMLSW